MSDDSQEASGVKSGFQKLGALVALVENKSWIFADKWIEFTKTYFDFLKNLSVVAVLKMLAEKSNSGALHAAAITSYIVLVVYVFFFLNKIWRFERFVNGKQHPLTILLIGAVLLITTYFVMEFCIIALNEIMFALVRAQKN